jgi:hypothetical protein
VSEIGISGETLPPVYVDKATNDDTLNMALFVFRDGLQITFKEFLDFSSFKPCQASTFMTHFADS